MNHQQIHQNQQKGFGNYWDIDDILAEEEKVFVKFNQDSKHNGLLDVNKQCTIGNDIKQGAILELPYWMAIELAKMKIDDDNQGHRLVDMEIPKFFQADFRKILKCDPTIVNLREKSQYYYEWAFKLADHLEDDEFIQVLLETYIKRMKEYSLISFHSIINDCSSKVTKMANLEENLFNYGRKITQEYKTWKQEGSTSFNGKYLQAHEKIKKLKIN